jgi:SnoaL-like protein
MTEHKKQKTEKEGVDMRHGDPVALVQAWQEAANGQDVDRLFELSDPNIEMVGPHGSSFGHQVLRDWLARAGLSLQTLGTLVDGNTVVVEQRGVWRSLETGEVTGEKIVASVFHVDDRHVVRFARYDNLDAALEAAGLSPR